ncbi:MAG TPA: hypothetical protein VFH51_13120, partial [Myxococcota bacterium]|nr:hypothetical protein [Myxococcota bacterium]
EEHLSERWSTVDLLSEDLFPKEAQASTTRTRDQRILWALAHIAQNFPRESGLEIASDNTLGAWGVKRSMPG